MDSNGSPEFGDRVAGVEYVPRPGAYALIFGESRALRFAAVEKIALDGPRNAMGRAGLRGRLSPCRAVDSSRARPRPKRFEGNWRRKQGSVSDCRGASA